nr:preprotein translocase SecG subunit [Chroomonas collegionis]
MIQILWMVTSLALIFAVMVHNPKSQGMGGQNQLFASSRSAEATLNKVTWGLVTTFFSLTTYLAIYNKID